MRQQTCSDPETGWKAFVLCDGDRVGFGFVAPDDRRSFVEIGMTHTLRGLALELPVPSRILDDDGRLLAFISMELLRRHISELQTPFWVWCS